MRFMRTVTWIMLTLAVCTRFASADPIKYCEAVSGDLPQQPPTSVLPLNVGQNTISGRMSLGVETDFDAFVVSISAADRLVRVTYEFVLFAPPEEDVATVSYVLHGGNDFYTLGPQFGTAEIDFHGPTSVTIFSSALPLAPGTYGFSPSSGQSRGLGTWAADYVWTLDVVRAPSPTPEPASVLLFAGGLGLLIRRVARLRN